MVVTEPSNTICTICYEHLKPPNEAIRAISICGHVFHDLCLKQWLDYCIQKTRIATCPVCKQKFSRENITRLYFQTTGTTGTDEEEWRLLCIKVNKSPQESEDITEQLRKWKEKARREMCMKNKALQEKELNQTLLEIRSQDLVQAESDCVMLRQSAASSSQPQAPGVTGGTSQNIAARNCDDIAYLMAVMNKFQDKREKYDEFIQVLKDFKAKKMDIRDVKSRVIDLLKGHADDLILGFNTFLPTGDGITLDLVMDDLPRISMESIINFVIKVKTNCEDHVYTSFLGILNMHRSNSTSTMAEVQQKITDLFQHNHHPDLVDELNNFLPH
ncbi:hypothetical protein MKX03_022606 [Papaver bracteatum]|nr:hypothetical protein MKX03_022606 [Papaver bracteatum]